LKIILFLTAVLIAKAIDYLPLEKHLRKSFSMSDVKNAASQ